MLRYNEQAKADRKELAIGIMILTGEAFWISDKDGSCIFASDALCRKIGRTEQEILHDNWANWMYNGDKGKVWSVWSEFVTHDRFFDLNYIFVHGIDGSLVKVRGKAYKIKGSDIIIGALFNQI